MSEHTCGCTWCYKYVEIGADQRFCTKCGTVQHWNTKMGGWRTVGHTNRQNTEGNTMTTNLTISSDEKKYLSELLNNKKAYFENDAHRYKLELEWWEKHGGFGSDERIEDYRKSLKHCESRAHMTHCLLKKLR